MQMGGKVLLKHKVLLHALKIRSALVLNAVETERDVLVVFLLVL